MAMEDQLAAIVSTLTIGLVGDAQIQPLEPVRARLMPEVLPLDVTEIVQAPLQNLKVGIEPNTVVQKDVRFSKGFPEEPTTDRTTYKDLDQSSTVLGGMPISTLGVEGVPGLIRQLSGVVMNITGTIPIPVKTKVPVTVLVKWSVTDDDGNELPPGKGYRAPEGLDVPTPSFLFLPSFTEESPPPAPTITRKLKAAVKLIAGGITYPHDPADPYKMVELPNVIDIKVPSVPLTPLLVERFAATLANKTLDPGEEGVATLNKIQAPNLFSRLQELFPEVKVSASSAIVKDNQQPSWSSWEMNAPLTFHLRPELRPLTPGAVGDTWDLRVQLAVSNLPQATGDVLVELPAVPMIQLPVLLPLIVAGFDQRHWEGEDMIVFVDPKSGLVSGHLDANSDSAAVDTVKQVLLTPLDLATGFLTNLLGLFPDLLPGFSGQLTTLKEFINHIRVRMPSKIVITGEQSRDNLGTYQREWHDDLSSLFMIGAPDGVRTLKLFEGENKERHELQLRMPAGHIAASYWTLHESAFHQDNRDSYSSPPVVPDPGVFQEGRADNYPFGSFGNMAKSFIWSPQ